MPRPETGVSTRVIRGNHSAAAEPRSAPRCQEAAVRVTASSSGPPPWSRNGVATSRNRTSSTVSEGAEETDRAASALRWYPPEPIPGVSRSLSCRATGDLG